MKLRKSASAEGDARDLPNSGDCKISDSRKWKEEILRGEAANRNTVLRANKLMEKLKKRGENELYAREWIVNAEHHPLLD